MQMIILIILCCLQPSLNSFFRTMFRPHNMQKTWFASHVEQFSKKLKIIPLFSRKIFLLFW